MSKVRVASKRETGGLYHYGHFILDCLIPEINNGLYTYDTVYRMGNENQTLGNNAKLYQEIMQVKHVEVPEHVFKNMTEIKKVNTRGLFQMKYNKNKRIIKASDLRKARNYVIHRYGLTLDPSYPEIILIRRGHVKKLVDAKKLKKDVNIKNGSQRRKIQNIDSIIQFLTNKKVNFKCIVLEELSFKEQVKYFMNANLVIGIYGAGLCNLIWCKHGTKVLEIQEEKIFEVFKRLCKGRNLRHHACQNDHRKIKAKLNGLLKPFIQNNLSSNE